MPKTSASQCEMLVDYMERNGDLSKPTTGPNGRLNSLKQWQNLTDLLNADATGDTKSTEKWRKVWSDLKNNTKRKKSRIMQSAGGTGGGPATKLKLSDLEDRVLNIIGPQAATGIPEVPEIGLSQEIIPVGPSPSPQAVDRSESYLEVLYPLADSMHEPAGSMHEPAGSMHESAGSIHVLPGSMHEPAGSMHESAGSIHMPRNSMHVLSPRREEQSATTTNRRRLTPRRRRRLVQDNETSPVQRRRARLQTQSERAREALLESDREWRAFHMNREEEANRLREMELAQQARWQDLFATFLATCNTLIEIFKNKNT